MYFFYLHDIKVKNMHHILTSISRVLNIFFSKNVILQAQISLITIQTKKKTIQCYKTRKKYDLWEIEILF